MEAGGGLGPRTDWSPFQDLVFHKSRALRPEHIPVCAPAARRPGSDCPAAETWCPFSPTVPRCRIPSRSSVFRRHKQTNKRKAQIWFCGQTAWICEVWSSADTMNGPSGLDYQLLCHFLMRLYARSGGGAAALPERERSIFTSTGSFIQQPGFTQNKVWKKAQVTWS